jgi:uncharacterized protein
MTVPQRVSLVTLGVADVTASSAFYERLGWRRSGASVDGDATFIRTPGAILGLWSAEELVKDAGRVGAPVSDGFRGVALAINVASSAEVDAVIAAWVAAGGTITRPAAATDWGGYSGYVADPDGHAWEIAHNPFWPLDERGMPQLLT